MKTTLACPVCNRQFTRIHTADKPPRFCSRACSNKAPGRMTAEIKARISRPGASHPNFRGGWLNKTTGYITIGKTLLHRIVWNNAHPDDPLKPGEVIHHINDNKLDNRPENLEKLPSQSAHFAMHAKRLLPHRKRNAKGRFIKGLHD